MNENDSRSRTAKESNELLNKLLSKSTIITSFSLRPEDIPVLDKFKEIARREAGSRGFSQIVISAMREYNHRHGEGNPQLKLTPYVDGSAPSPMRVLCLHLDGAISDGTLHCNRVGAWIKGVCCYSCNHNRLRKTKHDL